MKTTMSNDEKQIQRNYRAMLKRNHFCRECLKQDAYTLAGRVYCFECTEKRKQQRHAKVTIETKQKDAELHRAIRAKRRDEHVCVRCGKPLEPNDSHTACAICR